MREIKTLLIGATYFSIGYASVHPECMILESSQIMGGDFERGVRTADISGISEAAANSDLAEIMKEYGAFADGKFDVMKATPILHEYSYRKKEMNIILDAKLLSVTTTDGGYLVKYMTNTGIRELFCEKLLDTTILRESCPSCAKRTAKTLNIFTVRQVEDFADRIKAVSPDSVIVDGMNPNETIVKFPFDIDARIIDAYETVIALWKKAFPAGEDCILVIAQDFEYTCEPVNEDAAPCKWNGGRYSDPLTAFAAGMDCTL